ncbi:hypothetical protein, partial [uncultured Arthrobacter sp.]|uniref:hypothetical protein n=1 Tax=uncultured Arthrobacter sp. TaxID=114050 RepID=UPI003216367E
EPRPRADAGGIDTSAHSRAFDAYVRVDDILAAIAQSSAWKIEVHETTSCCAPGARSADDRNSRLRHSAAVSVGCSPTVAAECRGAQPSIYFVVGVAAIAKSSVTAQL